MTCPQSPLKVVIISSSPIYASGLQRLVESSAIDAQSESFPDPAMATPSHDLCPAPVLVAPRDWRELGEWIPALRKRFPIAPWIILAELRMVGMFLMELESQPCVVVDPTRTPSDLSSGLRAALAGETMPLHGELLSRFFRRGGLRPEARRARMPSGVELAVSCGVGLGLSNREIGEALHLSESTIKTHLHRLTCRMDFASRAEIRGVVRTALAGAR